MKNLLALFFIPTLFAIENGHVQEERQSLETEKYGRDIYPSHRDYQQEDQPWERRLPQYHEPPYTIAPPEYETENEIWSDKRFDQYEERREGDPHLDQ